MVPEPQPLLQDWVGRTYDWVLFQPLGILWFSFTFFKEMKQIMCLSTGDLWEAVNLTISVIFGSFITAKFTECCFCVVLFLYRRIPQNGEQYLKIIFCSGCGLYIWWSTFEDPMEQQSWELNIEFWNRVFAFKRSYMTTIVYNSFQRMSSWMQG